MTPRRARVLDAMGVGPYWQQRNTDTASLSVSRVLTQDVPSTSPLCNTDDTNVPSPLPITLIPWETLQTAVAHCRQCRLCETRAQPVFGRGNVHAQWMFIGEAPGEQEDKQGQPFVGKAGKLLDNMLAALGLNRDDDVYIANVIKCRPPGNRNPSSDEIAACEQYLIQQIHHVQPLLLVALGRFAAHTLLKTEEKIANLRGKVHTWQQRPLIVTYHPAYLLRNLPDKAKTWQDLVFAQHVYQQQRR